MGKKAGRQPARKAIRHSANPPSGEDVGTSAGPDLPNSFLPAGAAFPIVGVGASAGGLEAFSQLLENLPSVTGMAYVLIQHLDPSHASQLPEILARKTAMPVREIQQDTVVEADHIYVIPAGENLRIEKGVLHTVPRSTAAGSRKLAVDDFLESLAVDRGNLAFGVILSGTASDGTVGLRAIKAEGGITFAQEPSTAKFEGMPSSAIAAGTVDFVLSPEAIAKQLVALATHPYLHRKSNAAAETEVPPAVGDLNPIFGVLRSATGIDFTHYKHNTILRRIERRMALHGIDTLPVYTQRLRHDRAEAKILAQDFLINVTAFFRERPKYSKSCERPCFLLFSRIGTGMSRFESGCRAVLQARSRTPLPWN